jgi:hypothetical protein
LSPSAWTDLACAPPDTHLLDSGEPDADPAISVVDGYGCDLDPTKPRRPRTSRTAERVADDAPAESVTVSYVRFGMVGASAEALATGTSERLTRSSEPVRNARCSVPESVA